MDINASEYIDVDTALKRVGGNMDLFKRLLGRFVAGNNFEALDNALKGGDSEESARLAHTLKGVSSNLSLDKVAALSASIEQLIKGGADYTACLEELRQAYDVTVAKIAEMTS